MSTGTTDTERIDPMPNPGRRRDDSEQTVRMPGLARALRAIETAPPITGPTKADRSKVAKAAAQVIRNRNR